MDEVGSIAGLIKQFGISAAGWILLAAGMAWLFRKGGKPLYDNMSMILRQSAEMRETALKELREANATITDLRDRLADADEQMRRERALHDEAVRRLRQQMALLESNVGRLLHDLQVAQGYYQASDLPRR